MFSDLDHYAADPHGRTVAGAGAFIWFMSPELRIIRVWGEVSPATAEFVLDATRPELAPGFPRFSSLIDGRGLIGAAPGVYDRAVAIGAAYGAGWQPVVRRSVFLHDGGFAGVAVAAFFGYARMLGIEIPTTVHTELTDAVGALGLNLDPEALEAALTARREATDAQTFVVAGVREWIAAHLSGATVGDCAQALGVSARSLQRSLSVAGTSFRALLHAGRVERAKVLLAETDLKVSAVADEVGYPKIQSLAEVFRRATGEAPAEWRAARRR